MVSELVIMIGVIPNLEVARFHNVSPSSHRLMESLVSITLRTYHSFPKLELHT